MSDIAIRIENLGKRYRLQRATSQPRYRTLRDELIEAPARIWSTFRSRAEEAEDFWALRNVTLEVKQGEVLGVIGRNGAGKSTLLKILSRVVEPSEGSVDLYGRVGSLLEVGTGFHPELTGRENVFLSGAILGMRRHEVRKRLDEIVAFAEVEKFIDTPCKHYSSGMFMRLGFAVAAHLQADILVVDEVLAVGDAAFQQRCLRKMESVAGLDGRTILFVSHNIAAVRRLCSKAAYFKSGQLAAVGHVDEAIDCYSAEQEPLPTELARPVALGMACGFEFVRLNGLRAGGLGGFVSGRPIEIEIGIVVLCPLRTVQVALRISTGDGMPILTTSNFDSMRRVTGFPVGRYRLAVIIPPLFAPGAYKLTVAMCDPQKEIFDLIEEKIGFSVDGIGSLLMDLNDGRRGCIELPLPWRQEVMA